MDLSSLLPIGGSIIDAIFGNNRYDDQADSTKEMLAFQKQLMEQSAKWQGGNNDDIMDYIMGINPQVEEEQSGLNTGNQDWADYVNSLRSGFAGDVNDETAMRVEGADNLAGDNFINQQGISGGQKGISNNILDIALSRDPSAYARAAEGLAGDISSDPYDLETMMSDAQTAANMGIDRVYDKQMDAVSRDSVRQGTDASGAMLDLSSQAARDQVEATLKARLAVPQSYESTLATRQGRIGGAINTLEGAAGGIDSRAMSGAGAAAGVLGAAGGTLNNAASLGINTLLHQPDYEDPSEGMVNPLDKYKSALALRANPYAAKTNPYSGLKPAIPAYPRDNGSDIGKTIGAGLWSLLQGGN